MYVTTIIQTSTSRLAIKNCCYLNQAQTPTFSKKIGMHGIWKIDISFHLKILLLLSLVYSSSYPKLTHDPKGQNTRDHLAWTIWNGDTQYTSLMGEARGRNRQKNNARVVGNLEERNVGMKGKSPKQDITSAKDLTIELPEGSESPYHRI